MKVALSEISYNTSEPVSESTRQEIRHSFLFIIESKLGIMPVGSGMAHPKPVICRERKPSVDGTDFSTEVVDGLNAHDVLLELWGNISVPQNEEISAMAWLCILVVPIRCNIDDNSDLGFLRMRYNLDSKNAIEDFMRKINHGLDINLLAILAFGEKALKNKEYDRANSAFHTVLLTLDTAIKQKKITLLLADANRLKKYVEERIDNTKKAASEDENYEGALTIEELSEVPLSD